MSERLILQKDPDIIVTGQDLYDFQNARLESVRFGVGEMAVNLDAASHLDKQTRVVVFLASLGLPSVDIGNMLSITPGHVKSYYIGMALRELGMQRRYGFARHLIDVNALVPIKRHPPLKLSPRHIDIIDLITQGYESSSIASDLGLKEQTVKDHVYNATRKNDILGRAQLGLATLMSGQIEGYPAANLPPPLYPGFEQRRIRW